MKLKSIKKQIIRAIMQCLCTHPESRLLIEEKLKLVPNKGDGVKEVYLCKCLCRCGQRLEREIEFKICKLAITKASFFKNS